MTENDVKALAQEFIDYYTGRERHPSGGCGNCGGLPHSTTCFVGRFERALSAPRPQPGDAAKTEEMAEWGDAVAAIGGGPGAPPAEAIDRLVKAGDALNARIGLMTLARMLHVSAAPRPSGEREAGQMAGSAPPTSEAPADLVAVVREWQAAGEAYGAAQTASEHKAAQRRLGRARSVLQWWPRHPREDMERWDDWYQVAAPPTDAPAPVQAEMPTLRIGDVVLFGAEDDPPMWRRVTTHYEVGEVGARTDLKGVYGPRWVRPTGQETT